MEILINDSEIELIKWYAASCEDLPGAIAEVGVFEGYSARAIANELPFKKLYLFDTFEGLPMPANIDVGFKYRDYYPNIENFNENIKGLNVEVIKGIFPDSVKDIDLPEFCFVFLDCDLYKSILESIKYFWPKLVKNGVILIHDADSIGVMNAVLDSHHDFETINNTLILMTKKDK